MVSKARSRLGQAIWDVSLSKGGSPAPKMARKVMAAIEIDNQNVVTGGDCGYAGASAGS